MPTFTPISMSDRDAWSKIAEVCKDSTLLKNLPDELQKIPARPGIPTASDYLAAKRSNDRARLDEHWQSVRPRFGQLMLNRAIQGIDPYDPDDRLLDWLFDLTHLPTWVVSAHLPKMDLPLSGDPQIDLAGTSMAIELAEAREVLLPWIKSISATLDQTILKEINRRCIEPFVALDPPAWWADTTKPGTLNWSGVCAGHLLAVCVALAAAGQPNEKAMQKALDVLRFFFDKGFSQLGECDEGIGYWSYGVGDACYGLMRLSDDELKKNFDIERLKKIASFPGQVHLLKDTFFASNDSGNKASAGPAIPWLAEVTGDPFLKWWAANHPVDGKGVIQLQRVLWNRMTFAQTAAAAPIHPPARLLPDQQIAIFQQKSGENLISFTIIGGNNHQNHNHNDMGTFQYFIDETPIIADLGAPRYMADFFGPKRYTDYIVAASSGHCCPQINGQEQRDGKDTDGSVVSFDENSRKVEFDLTPSYPKKAALKSWRRSGKLSENATATVHDTFELESTSGEIVHRIWLIEEPKSTQDGVIESKRLHLSLNPPPQSVKVETFKPDDNRLRLRNYKPTELLYRIDATYAVKNGKLEIDTTIQPR